MSTANASSSPGATTNTPDRDRAADSDDSLARKRQRLSEEAEVRIEADEPEDMNGDLNHVIVIEDGFDNDTYSSTFSVAKNINRNVSPSQELEILHNQVNSDCKLNIVSLYFIFLRHPRDFMLTRPSHSVPRSGRSQQLYPLAQTAHGGDRSRQKSLADQVPFRRRVLRLSGEVLVFHLWLRRSVRPRGIIILGPKNSS